MTNTLKRTFKTFILMLILVLGTFVLAACVDDNDDEDNTFQEEIDFVNQLIEELDDTISYNDKLDVDYAAAMYDELSDEQKAQVVNVSKLESAREYIEYYDNEEDYVIKGYNQCKQYLDTIVPATIDTNINAIELPTVYNYQTAYKSYNFVLTWSTSNNTSISAEGAVYHLKEDKTTTLTCKITCARIKAETTFTKQILVNKSSVAEVEGPVVIAYYYGGYQTLSTESVQTIDIVNYSFAQIAKREVSGKTEFYIDVNGLYSIERITELHNFGIKVCISLGGWHDDSSFWSVYSEAASTDANRKMVANSLLEVLEKYNLDGVDMDWEYPKQSDRANYTALMKQISITLKSKRGDYIVSGAYPYESYINQRCDFASLNNWMDYFNLMTYDMDFDGSNVAKHMCAYSTTKTAIKTFTGFSVSKKKIVIGMAFYCREFYDVEATKNGYLQKCSGRAAINYATVKSKYLSRVGNGVTVYLDEIANSYYLYDSENKVFVSYESCQGIKNKYNLAVSEGIGGVMYWSHTDDRSGDYIHALLEAKQELNNK